MKLYTTQEVADMLKVTVISIRRYIKLGKLKAVKFGRELRITEEQLNDFIEKYSKGE